MNHSKPIYSKCVVFSKWSGKSYAVFASLKKVVNIARLSVDMSNISLVKTPALISLFQFSAEDNKRDEGDVFDEIVEPLELLQLLPLVHKPSDIVAQQKYISNNNNGKPIFCIVQNMGFLFLNQFEK